MIKVYRKGKKKNKVISLFDKIIIKRYLSRDRKKRELAGIKYWRNVNSSLAPRGYIKIGRVVVWQFSGVTIDNNEFNYLPQLSEIFLMLHNIYTNNPKYSYSFKKQWLTYINKIESYWLKYSKDIQNNLTPLKFTIFKNYLDYLLTEDWFNFKLIPIHRDLTTDNMIFDVKGSLKIIDFEHSLIGPIEYEFCNAVFWNDEFSINFNSLSELINNKKALLNKELTYKLVIFYFIDQLNIAKMTKDKEKEEILFKTLDKYIDNNFIFITDINQKIQINENTNLPGDALLYN